MNKDKLIVQIGDMFSKEFFLATLYILFIYLLLWLFSWCKNLCYKIFVTSESPDIRPGYSDVNICILGSLCWFLLLQKK